jgi:hypothetical protein
MRFGGTFPIVAFLDELKKFMKHSKLTDSVPCVDTVPLPNSEHISEPLLRSVIKIVMQYMKIRYMRNLTRLESNENLGNINITDTGIFHRSVKMWDSHSGS